MNHTYSHPLTFGLGKDGAPNALFDGLSRLVASFPTDREMDTRRGSPSTPETILANAKLFAAAPALVRALVSIYANAAENPEWIRRVAGEALNELESDAVREAEDIRISREISAKFKPVISFLGARPGEESSGET